MDKITFMQGKFFDSRNMRDPKIRKQIQTIRKTYLEEEGLTENVKELMKALREDLIQLEQPTLVKSVRLVYEFDEQFDGFRIDVWEEDNDISSFEYYLDLIANPFNKYNRDEIRELNDYLKKRLNGEEVEFGAEEEEEEDDDDEG